MIVRSEEFLRAERERNPPPSEQLVFLSQVSGDAICNAAIDARRPGSDDAAMAGQAFLRKIPWTVCLLACDYAKANTEAGSTEIRRQVEHERILLLSLAKTIAPEPVEHLSELAVENARKAFPATRESLATLSGWSPIGIGNEAIRIRRKKGSGASLLHVESEWPWSICLLANAYAYLATSSFFAVTSSACDEILVRISKERALLLFEGPSEKQSASQTAAENAGMGPEWRAAHADLVAVVQADRESIVRLLTLETKERKKNGANLFESIEANEDEIDRLDKKTDRLDGKIEELARLTGVNCAVTHAKIQVLSKDLAEVREFLDEQSRAVERIQASPTTLARACRWWGRNWPQVLVVSWLVAASICVAAGIAK